MVVVGVVGELVSIRVSLLHGKIQGNSAKPELRGPFRDG